jgi:hypothetical protein
MGKQRLLRLAFAASVVLSWLLAQPVVRPALAIARHGTSGCDPRSGARPL